VTLKWETTGAEWYHYCYIPNELWSSLEYKMTSTQLGQTVIALQQLKFCSMPSHEYQTFWASLINWLLMTYIPYHQTGTVIKAAIKWMGRVADNLWCGWWCHAITNTGLYYPRGCQSKGNNHFLTMLTILTHGQLSMIQCQWTWPASSIFAWDHSPTCDRNHCRWFMDRSSLLDISKIP
jgi:hypothetical protein